MAKLLQYKFLIVFLFVFGVLKTIGQTSVIYKIDSNELKLYRSLSLDSVFADRSAAMRYAEKLPLLLQLKGFVTASVDSIRQSETSIEVRLFLGRKYQWALPEIDHLKDDEKLMIKKIWSKEQNIQKLLSSLSNYYSSKGFVFIELKMDSIVITGDSVTGKLLIDKKKPVAVDSIHLSGKPIVNQNFLYRYLNVRQGQIFSDNLVSSVDGRLNALAFLQTYKPSEVEFFSTGAVLNLYLRSKSSNQVSAVIGFNNGSERKTAVTGDVKLNLQNSFGNGEKININWQQFQPRSPQLNIAFSQPYFARSKIGGHFLFDLYKKDSAFLNVLTELGAAYQFNIANSFSLSLKRFSGNISGVDTLKLKLLKQLPAEGDVSVTSAALGYRFNDLNAETNTSKGSSIFIESTIGSRSVKKNSAIVSLKDNSFNYEHLYDTVALRGFNFSFEIDAAHYFPVGSFSAVKTVLHIASSSLQKNFDNEKYRLGGIETLRGFNDQSILANRYAIFQCEYHYFLNPISYFRFLTDAAVTKDNTVNKYFSAGAGVVLSSKAGRLTLLYAVGKKNSEPVKLKDAKIHIGFSALF